MFHDTLGVDRMTTRRIQDGPRHPGDMLRELLARRGWTQADLSDVTGRSMGAINEVVRGRSGVTPDMALCLSAAFGNRPEDWLEADAAYRLSLISVDTSEIERRARLFSTAPIRDMQRRGWIRETDETDELEQELQSFRGEPLSVATRRSVALPDLTGAERAWCDRARQLASTLLANPFAKDRLSGAKSELRELAAHPKASSNLASVLAKFGIRFVVVEPIAGARIDGAALWDEIGPILAVSLRHDRIDGFWFTVMHEFSHIRHGDPISVDTAMVDGTMGVNARPAQNDTEERADREASSLLIPNSEIESFISRVGPLYPRDRIIKFANRIHIHPGIIVGQLQYRGEIGYASMRDLLVKVRDSVISTALTDGWGQAISPSVIRKQSK